MKWIIGLIHLEMILDSSELHIYPINPSQTLMFSPFLFLGTLSLFLTKGAYMIESILLVCPNEMESSRMVTILTQEFSVTPFKTGEDLLTYLTTYPIQDPVTIIDAATQDIPIDELARRIKLYSPMMLIMGLLHSDDAPYVVKAVKAGISEVLISPYTPADVLALSRRSFEHINLIDHLQRQINTLTEDSLKQRMSTFRQFLESRRSQGLPIKLNEIQLFFPSSNEIPINELVMLIESDSLKSLSQALNYRPKILIIEDEPLLNRLLNQIMSREFEVTCVFSAEEAITKIENGDLFDLALMDIGLPGVTGDEMVKDLKEICPSLQIIMVTGYTDSDRIVKTLIAGASDYVTKPFDPQLLMKKVSGHIQNKLIMDRIKKYLEGPPPSGIKKEATL